MVTRQLRVGLNQGIMKTMFSFYKYGMTKQNLRVYPWAIVTKIQNNDPYSDACRSNPKKLSIIQMLAPKRFMSNGKLIIMYD